VADGREAIAENAKRNAIEPPSRRERQDQFRDKLARDGLRSHFVRVYFLRIGRDYFAAASGMVCCCNGCCKTGY
jgi:hypothetical protein